ncbi:hypothetical protein BH09PAT2_BH09PAT2_01470 [soil metagenome]
MSELEFTGEYYIPGKTISRIEQDHQERYIFAAKYSKNKNILDIASGVGYGSKMLLDSGAKSVVGVDIDSKLVEYASKTYNTENIIFKKGDITSYKSDIKFDMITCFETIEHIPDDLAAIKNLYSLLKSGGHLFISSPNRQITSPQAKLISDKPSNKFHIREYLVNELVNLLEDNGFKVEGTFGQRMRLRTGIEFINKIITTILNPDLQAGAEIEKIEMLTPRYFLIKAKKE